MNNINEFMNYFMGLITTNELKNEMTFELSNEYFNYVLDIYDKTLKNVNDEKSKIKK